MYLGLWRWAEGVPGKALGKARNTHSILHDPCLSGKNVISRSCCSIYSCCVLQRGAWYRFLLLFNVYIKVASRLPTIKGCDGRQTKRQDLCSQDLTIPKMHPVGLGKGNTAPQAAVQNDNPSLHRDSPWLWCLGTRPCNFCIPLNSIPGAFVGNYDRAGWLGVCNTFVCKLVFLIIQHLVFVILYSLVQEVPII